MDTIKITNSQGQEEEWEEIDVDDWLKLIPEQCAEIKGLYYRKLPPKEVDTLEKIKIDEDVLISDFLIHAGIIKARKQALAESEKIQNEEKKDE